MWEDLYAELLNKFRWSIASAAAGQFNLSYRDSQAAARPLATVVLQGLKGLKKDPSFLLEAYLKNQLEEPVSPNGVDSLAG
jgi:hypothetical protein